MSNAPALCGPTDRTATPVPVPEIDTTPALPLPPRALLDAAAREIPLLFADLPPQPGAGVSLVAATLAFQIRKCNHTLAAAQWAIHEAVVAGRLTVGRVVVQHPGGSIPNLGYTGPASCWFEGRRGTKPVPKGRPAPFDCFTVTPTPKMWELWREPKPEPAHPNDPEVTSPELKPKAKRGRKLETDKEKDSAFAEAWQRSKAAKVPFKTFCKDRTTTVKDAKAILARVRMRKRSAVKRS